MQIACVPTLQIDLTAMEASLQQDQNIRILQIYNVYRVILVLALLLTSFNSVTKTNLGSHDPDLFLNVLLAYRGFSLAVLIFIKPEQTFTARQRLLSGLFIIDILVIAAISYSSRGVVSGLSLLHLVTIAAGGILIKGRMSTLLAAIASIATIYGEVYLRFTTTVTANQYIQSGLLGALLFSTSLYLQTLAERMRRSAALTAEQATSIVNLEQLNHLVIQRMRTGIVVVSKNGLVVTLNDAARQMLALTRNRRRVKSIADAGEEHIILPNILTQQLALWTQNHNRRLPTFLTKKAGPQLQANFAYLNPTTESNILIFIEDNSQFLQRVRQMKPASLGRLTASIAHEIRNPLGAISHASQLLQESKELRDADRRLLEIVLNHCPRVSLIIEDVLQMSRHRQENAERINLRNWLQEFVADYSEIHQTSGSIVVDIQPPETEIRVITSQLEQILSNLIENGLRYSERATGIANLKFKGGIDNKSSRRTPVLHVIDYGSGVDADTEEGLFEPFHTTEVSGTELGLYISKELCEANQAQLSYQKTKKGRSCFSIHFSHPDRNVD